MNSETRLACAGVTVRFGGLVAVRSIDLEVPPATMVGLVGPNGAGKSTLFGVLSGLVKPVSGEVRLNGREISTESPQARAALGLARTFQHPELFAGLTVREHLVLAHRIRHDKARVWSDLFTFGSLHPRDPGEQVAVDALIELLGIEAVADRMALGLPLGVARLVELGRALATAPSILLLDEPSSGLDSGETQQFEATLGGVVRERGISVLLVEHDVELVMRICSSVYVLDFGLLIASGTPEEVRTSPAVRAAYLGEDLPSGDPGADVPGVSVLNLPGGDHGSHSEPAPVPASAAMPGDPPRTPALAVRRLTVSYGEARALSDVSFEVGSGRVLAILGANGAGKSSLARAVSGLVPCTGGRIDLDGRQIDGWSAHRVRRAGLVHLPEGRGVFRSLSVADNLRMAAGVISNRAARREAIDAALAIFPALADRRHQTAGLLSGGEQQMLSLARALATAPKLVVADEMSLGLAPKMVDLVFEGLGRARELGVTVIMIEQYVHRALEFADDCLLLQRGSVAWTGPASEAADEVLANYLGPGMAAAT